MKMLLLPLFILMQNLIFGEAQTCAYSQFGSDHTMCKYKEKACPPGLLASGTTASDITAAVNTHNQLRNKVATGGQPGQPSATNMQEMKWDPELATIAQRWAEQCNFGHDSNRATKTFSYVGQNVATTGSTGGKSAANFTYAVNMWYSEVTNPGFSASNISPFKYDAGAGHYTQLAWATSNRVGCGFSGYKSGGFFRNLYVCNYGPGGNVVGAGNSMYVPGSPATACLKGKSTSYSGLCSS